MCGITGIFNTDSTPVSALILQNMTTSLSHRGPDGEGIFVKDNIGLGHRRLSIIDLSLKGKQPMIHPDNDLILSYNGEIYNFKELKKELLALGHCFISSTDSEVLLHAWHQWGPDCVKRLNGMFAFAIWDNNRKSLFLVRDRYGIKPLYYANWKNTFLFGSEQKAILEHPISSRRLDKRGLIEYMTFQNFLTDKTLIEGIKILEPASIAEIKQGSNKINISKYWDFEFLSSGQENIDKEEYTEELARLMRQSIDRQLVSDVEVGSYLSGGMDSGSIAALASEKLQNLKTFTVGFDMNSVSGIELSFDERSKARELSTLFDTDHREMILKSGDIKKCLPRFCHHLEEPRVGQSYPNYYAAELASKDVKVVLSGAGGDELFGGYPWRYYRSLDSKSFDDYVDDYYLYWQRLLDNRELKMLLAPIESSFADIWTKDIFRDILESHRNRPETPEGYINNSLYFESKTFLQGLLVVEDKLSMAHGLETRLPFLDNDLVDFATSCPLKLKLNNFDQVVRINENTFGDKPNQYFKKTNDGKQILREVVSSIIPKEVVDRVKQGFSSPDETWFRGESLDFVEEKLFNEDSSIYQWMDKSAVKSLVKEHTEGTKNRRLLIWSLLNLDQYFSENNIN